MSIAKSLLPHAPRLPDYSWPPTGFDPTYQANLDAMWGELECRKVEVFQAQARTRALEWEAEEANRHIRQLTGRLLGEGKTAPE